MSRPTRFKNTLSKRDRALWRQIRRELATRTAQKRETYGLRSNREAHLHIARQKNGT
jgi:hypothetical protein